MHSPPNAVIIGFDPPVYSVTEGVDGIVALRVVRTRNTAITVTLILTTVSGTAEGIELLRCCHHSFMCEPLYLPQQMAQITQAVQ